MASDSALLFESKRREAAEARAAELQRSIDGICEFYGERTIVSAVVDMHADRKRISELSATNATLTKRVAELTAHNEAVERYLIDKINNDNFSDGSLGAFTLALYALQGKTVQP